MSHINHATEFINYNAHATTPGAYFVDFFPIMKYIPAWMAPWKRQGLARYEEETRYYTHLFEDACEQVTCKVEDA